MTSCLRSLKAETKIKFDQNITNYYDELNTRRRSGTSQFHEDSFSRNAQGIAQIIQEVILFMRFLHTKPQVKNMNIIS